MKNLTAMAVVFARMAFLMLAVSHSYAEPEESNKQFYRLSDRQGQLEHVLVSVPMNRQVSQTALPVTVLSGDELRSAATSTIGDTLANHPGLANASFGPAVGQPVIRGQQGARVSVLQNSTRSADASNVSADHSISVEPLLADSIEVLRGPATLLYGGGAIGGIVNVIDNRIPAAPIEQLRGGMEYRHESASDLDVGVFRLESGSGKAAFHLSGLSRDWSDLEIPHYAVDEQAVQSLHEDHGEVNEPIENSYGRINNTAGRTHNLTAGASYFFDSGYVGAAVSYLENNYGLPELAHVHSAEEDGESGIQLAVEQTRYDVKWQLEQPVAGVDVLNVAIAYTDYQHDEIEANGEPGTHFGNDSWEGRFELTHEPWAGWQGVVGVQMRDGEFSAIGLESFIPKTESTAVGVFVVETYEYSDWIYEIGARVDSDKLVPRKSLAKSERFTSTSLSASMLWQITSQWQGSIALSNAQRSPVTEELFSNIDAIDDYVVHGATQSIEIGNSTLKREQSRNIDVAIKWSNERWMSSLTLYVNDFSDYIYLQNTSLEQDEIPILEYQQENAEFMGVEFELNGELLAWRDQTVELNIFADKISGEFDRGGDVPRLPPDRAGVKLIYTKAFLSAFINLVQASSQRDPGENESSTDAYKRWDVGVSYQLPLIEERSLQLFMKCNNVTDEEIRSSTSFLRNYAPEAGRSIVAGFRYAF